MRSQAVARIVPEVLRCAVLGATLVCGAGCGTLRATLASYATGPNGITHPQETLRGAFVDNDFTKAIAWHEDDALLQSLTTGIASYYASQFARSGAVLDTAALLADDRITASVSKDGLSLMTNDMARPYQPRRTERLFIPYYAMLSYVQLGAWEDAAVEARRLVALLAQFGDDRADDEREMHGAMGHLAGAVFERAGDLNDAQVAYRAAHALLAQLPERVPRSTIADEGELLVIVERGFVAHRTTETIELYLPDADRDSLRRGGEGHRNGATVSLSAAAAAQAHAFGTLASSRHRHRDDEEEGYHLTVAFPSLRRSARPWGGEVRLAVDDATVTGITASSVVDDASAADARREWTALAARAAARAVTKYAVTKAIKDRKGEVAGSIANFGASLLERADVRSWHLLPQELTLLRVRVPAGTREVRIDAGEGWATRTVRVGNVVIRRGELTIVPVRLWRDPPPGPAAGQPSLAEADQGCATFFCP